MCYDRDVSPNKGGVGLGTSTTENSDEVQQRLGGLHIIYYIKGEDILTLEVELYWNTRIAPLQLSVSLRSNQPQYVKHHQGCRGRCHG